MFWSAECVVLKLVLLGVLLLKSNALSRIRCLVAFFLLTNSVNTPLWGKYVSHPSSAVIQSLLLADTNLAAISAQSSASIMASKAESVLVFGATGNIGLHILNELALALEAGTFRRLAIFTSQNTVDSKSSLIKDLQSRGVEVFVGDIADKSTLQSVISNSAKPLNSGKDNTPFDTLVSAAGRAAILSQIPIIEIAEQTPSVKRYYPSEFGTDIEHPVTNDKEPPHQLKLKVRKYIREHVKRLDVTYLVVGPFPEFWFRMTKGTEYTGGFDVNNKKAILLGDGKGAVAFTSMPE